MIHDALLVEGPVVAIEQVAEVTRQAMAEASRIVLDGFELRTDSKIVRHPDRYVDPRGLDMWERVAGSHLIRNRSGDLIRNDPEPDQVLYTRSIL